MGIFEELGGTNLDPLPLSLLLSHPAMQEIISSCTTYKAVVSTGSYWPLSVNGRKTVAHDGSLIFL